MKSRLRKNRIGVPFLKSYTLSDGVKLLFIYPDRDMVLTATHWQNIRAYITENSSSTIQYLSTMLLYSIVKGTYNIFMLYASYKFKGDFPIFISL